MQSGLSWITILRKRQAFRAAFFGFDPGKIAKFGAKDIDKLLANPEIIRNRAKVEAAVTNAQATLKVQKIFGSLDSFLWNLVDGQPVINHWTNVSQIPAKTPISERLAKELKAQGFKFIGPTVAYAFMQAIGMVNDHETGCDRHKELARRVRPARSKVLKVALEPAVDWAKRPRSSGTGILLRFGHCPGVISKHTTFGFLIRVCIYKFCGHPVPLGSAVPLIESLKSKTI